MPGTEPHKPRPWCVGADNQIENIHSRSIQSFVSFMWALNTIYVISFLSYSRAIDTDWELCPFVLEIGFPGKWA